MAYSKVIPSLSSKHDKQCKDPRSKDESGVRIAGHKTHLSVCDLDL